MPDLRLLSAGSAFTTTVWSYADRWTSRCYPTFTDTPKRRAAGFPGDPKRVDTAMAPANAGG
jgi:hypothetical protein